MFYIYIYTENHIYLKPQEFHLSRPKTLVGTLLHVRYNSSIKFILYVHFGKQRKVGHMELCIENELDILLCSMYYQKLYYFRIVIQVDIIHVEYKL